MTTTTPTPLTETRRFRVIQTIIGAFNPVMGRLLASRFGAAPGKALMLLRFRGRRTGAWHSTPVGYVREGDTIVVVTSPTYRWWKNVVGGAPVHVRAAGQWYAATARVLMPDDPLYDETVALQLRGRGPRMLRGFGVPVTDDGRIPDEARAEAPSKAHIVRIELGAPIERPA